MDSLPLGERIRAARLERKMTQDELARDTFSKSYVSAVELGKIQPSIKALRILARRLQLPASSFLETLEPDIETQQTLLAFARVRMLVALGERDSEALAEIEKLDLDRLSEIQVAEALYLEGKALSGLQRDSEALTKLEESKNEWEEIDENEGAERVRNLVGEIYFRQRKYIQAQEQHRACLVAIHAGQVRDVSLKLSIYANLAKVYSALDMHDAARTLFKEANAEARAVASIYDLVETRTRIADEYVEDEKYISARHSIENACAALETVDISRLVTNLRLVFGQVYAAGHNWEEAEKCYQSALENTTLQPPTAVSISALISLANLYLRQNRIDEALQIANEARVALERNSNQVSSKNSPSYPQRAGGEIILTLARISEQKGDLDQADTLFYQALELLKTSSDSELLSSAYFLYGEALLLRGEAQRGAQYLKLAYEERSRGTN
jgi:tetratricopeptide (TPR) repeat protein